MLTLVILRIGECLGNLLAAHVFGDVVIIVRNVEVRLLDKVVHVIADHRRRVVTILAPLLVHFLLSDFIHLSVSTDVALDRARVANVEADMLATGSLTHKLGQSLLVLTGRSVAVDQFDAATGLLVDQVDMLFDLRLTIHGVR